jgi:hypothetical protein
MCRDRMCVCVCTPYLRLQNVPWTICTHAIWRHTRMQYEDTHICNMKTRMQYEDTHVCIMKIRMQYEDTHICNMKAHTYVTWKHACNIKTHTYVTWRHTRIHEGTHTNTHIQARQAKQAHTGKQHRHIQACKTGTYRHATDTCRKWQPWGLRPGSIIRRIVGTATKCVARSSSNACYDGGCTWM